MSTMLNAQITATEPPSPSQNITENTTCLILSFGSIEVKRTVKDSQIHQKGDAAAEGDAPVEVDADTDLVSVSKKLIVSAEFDAIQRERRKLKKWIKSLTVPSLFKEGIYRVNFRAVPRITDRIKEFIPQDRERVQKFIDVYRQRCDETRVALKSLGEVTDYPPVARVQASFYVEYRWMSFTTDDRLREQVSEQFFREELARNETKVTQATDAIILMMRTELQEMVSHFVESLTPNEDGTKKRFHASTVTKIREFLENFRLRNVTNDQQLEMVVRSAEQLLDGVDVKDIKKNEAVGDQTLRGMSLVKQCLDSLVVEAGSRRIFLAPEPEPVSPALPGTPLPVESVEVEEDAFAEVL